MDGPNLSLSGAISQAFILSLRAITTEDLNKIPQMEVPVYNCDQDIMSWI